MSDEFDQLRQAAFQRSFDFAAVFAQLGRNPGAGRARRRSPSSVSPATRCFVFQPEQAVFIEREAQLERAAAQQDVVLLAAGEILHGRAVAFVRQRAQIHLQALEPILDAGFVGAFAEHAVRLGMLHESLERVGARRGR